MTLAAERSNTFISNSFKPLVAAGALAASTIISGYVHSESGVQQSTSGFHSPAPKLFGLTDEYRVLDELLFNEQENGAKALDIFVPSGSDFLHVKQMTEVSINVVEDFIDKLSSGDVAGSFFDRVSHFAKNISLNKSQLASVLRVERKSIYDWKRNPDVKVREITRKRVVELENFVSSMDEGHSQYLAKLAFGSNGHEDLAKALLSEELSIDLLNSLYDEYWVEFDGYFTRSRIEAHTKGFESSDGFGELV